MHINEMSSSVEKFFYEADKLQWKKNADYHPDKVAMLEILQTAFETDITVEQDLWARIRKQMSALQRFVIEGYVESEPPGQRMMDVAVYMGIMNFWMNHKVECVRDAFEFIRDHRNCETFGGIGMTAGKTCIREGKARDSRCDRCAFVTWLGDYNAR